MITLFFVETTQLDSLFRYKIQVTIKHYPCQFHVNFSFIFWHTCPWLLFSLMTLCKTKWDCDSFLNQWDIVEYGGHVNWSLVETRHELFTWHGYIIVTIYSSFQSLRVKLPWMLKELTLKGMTCNAYSKMRYVINLEVTTLEFIAITKLIVLMGNMV